MKKLVLISCLILSACASNTEKSLPNNVLRTDTERAMGWPEKYIRALGAREEMANGSSVAYTVRTKKAEAAENAMTEEEFVIMMLDILL